MNACHPFVAQLGLEKQSWPQLRWFLCAGQASVPSRPCPRDADILLVEIHRELRGHLWPSRGELLATECLQSTTRSESISPLSLLSHLCFIAFTSLTTSGAMTISLLTLSQLLSFHLDGQCWSCCFKEPSYICVRSSLALWEPPSTPGGTPLLPPQRKIPKQQHNFKNCLHSKLAQSI